MLEDKRELNMSEGQQGGHSDRSTGNRAGEDTAVRRSARARQKGHRRSQERAGVTASEAGSRWQQGVVCSNTSQRKHSLGEKRRKEGDWSAACILRPAEKRWWR